MDTPLPPVHGKYCVRGRYTNLALRCIDAGLSALPRQRIPAPVAPPRRILIVNTAHIGDVVLSTSVLPVIKSAFPGCAVGFLVGSWCSQVVREHCHIDTVHTLDHWMENRSDISVPAKLARYARTRLRALQELRETGYDTAIDLRWNIPSMIPLLWRAGVPRRIGYDSSGCGALATDSLPFDGRQRHVMQRYLDLLRLLPISDDDAQWLSPSLPETDTEADSELQRELGALGGGDSDYVLCHAGAGLRFKEWPVSNWRTLAVQLSSVGRDLVFTGRGTAEQRLVSEIVERSGGLNLCDKLSWKGFVAAIRRAKLVVCGDTAAVHVAGAVGTPCIAITSGRIAYAWSPVGPRSQVLTHATPCAPCHRSLGCDGMECIRLVEPSEVFNAITRLVDGRASDHTRSHGFTAFAAS